MKYKKIIAFGILSGVVSTGIVTAILFLKRKLKEDDDLLYEEDDEMFFDYGVFEFETINDMNRAIKSKRINIDSTYKIDKKGYIIAILDGNENIIYEYGGRQIAMNEIKQLKEKLSTKTMYFYIPNKDYLNKFLRSIDNFLTKKQAAYILKYNGRLYVDLSDLNKEKHEKIRHMASEFYAEEILNKDFANEIKKFFDKTKNKR